jgi:hypothetical protein
VSIDSAAKRISILNFASEGRLPGIIPDGTVNARDRITLLGLYSGFSPGNAYTITPLSGSYVVTGQDAILSPTTRINTAQRRLSIMALTAPWRTLRYVPGGAPTIERLALIGQYTGYAATSNAYTLTAVSGIYTYDGEPSFSDFEITCVSGSYALSGSSATLIATRLLSATSGVYTYTGYDSTLIKFTGRTLQAVSGVFTYSGADANLVRPRNIILASGSYVLGG